MRYGLDIDLDFLTFRFEIVWPTSNVCTHKLGAQFHRCMFIRYPKESRGYYFYHVKEQKLFLAVGHSFWKGVS